MAKGPKIVDRDLGWEELFARAREIKESYVKVGVLEDGKGGEEREGGITNAELAALLEFGNEDNGGHIPARPAFRMTFDQKRDELVAFGRTLMKAVFDGKMDVRQALNLLGSKVATEVKKTITESPLPGVPPPNAPSTAAAKGGFPETVRTWIDTGRLVGAITWAIFVRGR